MPWIFAAVILFAFYFLLVVLSAFMIKRGLMLGGSGRESYFSGFLEGRGTYAMEDQMLRLVGAARKEFPLDIVFVVGYAGFFGWAYREEDPLLGWSMAALLIVLGGVALFRRTKLQRR